MEADAAPRRRVAEWVRQQLAADPVLDAQELARRALDHFAEDAGVLALAFRRGVGQEGQEHREEGDR